MNDDALKQLLQAADDGVAPPRLSADALLAAALRRRRRATQRKAAASLAFVGVLAVVMMAPRQSPESVAIVTSNAAADWSLKRPVRSASGDALRRELERLDREADLRLQVVRAVTQPTAPIDDAPNLSIRDAELVRLESARSAALSWQYATLVEYELQDLAAARREYQRVADRFPGTTWADLAVHSVSRLSAGGEPSS